MDSALRPMSTSEVLDRTFHLYRTHFVTLAGIGVLLPALFLILELAFLRFGYVAGSTNSQPTTDDVGLTMLFTACYILVFIFGYSLVSGAAFHAVSRLHLGRQVTIVESYKKVFRRFPTVFRLVFSISVRAMGPFVAAFIILIGIVMGLRTVIGSMGRSAAIASVVVAMLTTFLLALVWTIYIYIKYSMSVAACLAEKLRTREALKRSRFLTQQARLRIFLVFLLMGIIGLALRYAFTAPSQYYSFMHDGKLTVPWAILEYLGGFAAAALAGPISTIAIVLIYYDQRVRKEAFDLQFMMENLDQHPQEQAAMSAT
ncbi:MAG TPA: hypothetical protein VG488_01405 [Candidatus Angelobacter sp.]|nr:hypothetical protein [Candidatus Angelobacter sp.]